MVIYKILLKLIPRHQILAFLGRGALAQVELFRIDGWNNLLYDKHKLVNDDSILILGGYKGRSAISWRKKYDSPIIIVEPIPIFFEDLKRNTREMNDVSLINLAIGKSDTEIEISMDSDSTGSFSSGGPIVRVQQKDISTFLVGLTRFPSIIEMNIEGAEYDVLERLIETNLHMKINTLLIQFHKIGPDYLARYVGIQDQLEKTHKLVFQYEFVWERWDLL
jgi:FkbM family methyltransferase